MPLSSQSIEFDLIGVDHGNFAARKKSFEDEQADHYKQCQEDIHFVSLLIDPGFHRHHQVAYQ